MAFRKRRKEGFINEKTFRLRLDNLSERQKLLKGLREKPFRQREIAGPKWERAFS